MHIHTFGPPCTSCSIRLHKPSSSASSSHANSGTGPASLPHCPSRNWSMRSNLYPITQSLCDSPHDPTMTLLQGSLSSHNLHPITQSLCDSPHDPTMTLLQGSLSSHNLHPQENRESIGSVEARIQKNGLNREEQTGKQQKSMIEKKILRMLAKNNRPIKRNKH